MAKKAVVEETVEEAPVPSKPKPKFEVVTPGNRKEASRCDIKEGVKFLRSYFIYDPDFIQAREQLAHLKDTQKQLKADGVDARHVNHGDILTDLDELDIKILVRAGAIREVK